MDDPFKIEFSASLIKQLANDGEKSKKKTKKSKPKTPPREPKHPPKNAKKQISSNSENTKNAAPPLIWPAQSPLFFPVSPPPQSPNPELEAIRSTVLESEKVLEKIKKQEEFKIQEVTQRAKDLHEREFKLPEHKAQPCLNEKGACYDCYKINFNNPLKCGDLVKNYADCVLRGRQGMRSTDN